MRDATPITVAVGQFEDLFERGLRSLIEDDPDSSSSPPRSPRGAAVVFRHAARGWRSSTSARCEARWRCARWPSSTLTPTRAAGQRAVRRGECAQLLALGASACLPRPRRHATCRTRSTGDARDAADLRARARPQRAAWRCSPRASQGARAAAATALQRADRRRAAHRGRDRSRTHARNIYRKLGVASRRELSLRPRA